MVMGGFECVCVRCDLFVSAMCFVLACPLLAVFAPLLLVPFACVFRFVARPCP